MHILKDIEPSEWLLDHLTSHDKTHLKSETSTLALPFPDYLLKCYIMVESEIM